MFCASVLILELQITLNGLCMIVCYINNLDLTFISANRSNGANRVPCNPVMHTILIQCLPDVDTNMNISQYKRGLRSYRGVPLNFTDYYMSCSWINAC